MSRPASEGDGRSEYDVERDLHYLEVQVEALSVVLGHTLVTMEQLPEQLMDSDDVASANQAAQLLRRASRLLRLARLGDDY